MLLKRFDETSILRAAVEYYGADAQQKMLLEEMSELQKEICKHWRGQDNVQKIAEEIADVLIVIDQMLIIFDCSAMMQSYRAGKIERLRERMIEAWVEQAEEMA